MLIFVAGGGAESVSVVVWSPGVIGVIVHDVPVTRCFVPWRAGGPPYLLELLDAGDDHLVIENPAFQDHARLDAGTLAVQHGAAGGVAGDGDVG